MKISDKLEKNERASLALGFFDGIHSGHRVILKNAVNEAGINNSHSVVITFKEHPSEYFSSVKIPRLLNDEEKLSLFESSGIDYVYMLNFEKIYNLLPEEYIKNILIKYFTPSAITTGFNHTFGKNAAGTSELLRRSAKDYGYKYFEVPPYLVDNNIVSCSKIRNFISDGNIYEANRLLGYEFFIKGTVIQGEHKAATLGFPSANIMYPDEKVKIPHGVYYVKVKYENKEYDGVLNFGFGPATGNRHNEKTEVHILDFDKNIYGEQIKISFVTKIRNQYEFENIDKLKEQINRDIAFARIYKKFQNTDINITYKKYF